MGEHNRIPGATDIPRKPKRKRRPLVIRLAAYAAPHHGKHTVRRDPTKR